MTKYWRVLGRADAYFYVKAESESEALDKAQEGDYERVTFENEEAFYEEAFEVSEEEATG